VWTGSSIEAAKKKFWEKLHGLVKVKYSFQKIQGVDKLSTLYMAMASNIGEMKSSQNTDNLLVRVQVQALADKLMDYRGNSGYFYEYDCEDILEIRDFCNNTHCQTVGVLGDKDLLRPLFESGIKGIDRVVPIGHTMDFDFIWDGYNLVERLTRTVEL
jgi:F0F1-type ATP synthase alpha subunit